MTRQKIVQAQRPRADGEDGRELHGGARGAGRRRATREAAGERRSTADLRRGGSGAHRPRLGGVVRPARRVGRGERAHKEIARWLAEEHGVGGWWAQSVTVGYERARGGARGRQHPDGLHDHGVEDGGGAGRAALRRVRRRASARALAARRRAARAHGDRPKSARYDWDDGATRVIVGFEAKGDGKSTVALAHERLPDADEAEQMKAWWRERLGELRAALEATDVEGARAMT